MNEKVFAVEELNSILKRICNAEEYLHGILLEGEVANFKISGRHAYFTLKDDKAQIFCTFFNIIMTDTVYPKNGDKVLVRGSIDFYIKGGSISFKVSKMTEAGLGALYIKFIELKEKLEKEGLFDEKYKKSIPTYPKRIGVVTSETGAVIHDIINVTKRRNPFVDIVLFPCKVQGENADISTARGIQKLDDSKIVDIIIVGRGGGSMEDLQGYNSEIVARAVFSCETPIISAVGHETDFTLCDFASDLRAPTPSAAAELAIPNIVLKLQEFLSLSMNIRNKSIEMQEKHENDLQIFADKLRFLGEKNINNARLEVKQFSIKIVKNIEKLFSYKLNNIELLKTELDGNNPTRLLNKGYSMLSINENAINTIKKVNVGDDIKANLIDGNIKAKITSIEIKEN